MADNIKVRKRLLKTVRIFFLMMMDFRKELVYIKDRGYIYAQKKMHSTHEKRATELYNIAISLGGVMIKLCQFLSARRDLLPEPYIKILSALQDNVPPLDFTVIEKVLHEEYGDYTRIFKRVHHEPLASASLGQVHLAELPNGRTVVLKILKPHIEKVIDTDFAILDRTFHVLSGLKVFRQLSEMYNILEEFFSVTGDELNFAREIYILKKFKHDFASFDYVRIPDVYDGYCTRKIIAMEYLIGNKINNIDQWVHRNNDPVIISRRLIAIYMEQFLFTKRIHYDPHPGNLLITENNTIILLDFGMSGEITEEMNNGIKDSIEAVMKKDYRGMVDILDRMGFIKKGFNKYSLLPIVEYFFNELMEKIKLERESLHTLDLRPIFNELVEIIYLQPFNIPTEWAFIGKTVGVLSGIISMLNPDFRFYDELKPYADKIITHDMQDIFTRALKTAKTNFNLMVELPSRMNAFIENMEKGYYKIHIDYSEIIDKIDEVKEFAIRIISLILSSVSAVGAYYFHNINMPNLSYLFVLVAVIGLLMAVFYRKKTRKDRMIKYF